MVKARRRSCLALSTLTALALLASALQGRPAAAGVCGTLVTIPAHDGSTMAYSLAAPAKKAVAALVLLPGGSGHVRLDADGCPHDLEGNSLIRQQPMFHEAGFYTALVDAPSDHQGEDGLGGFRIEADHAADIGKVIADVRARTKLPVWLAGTSRGSISAANAAARLTGPEAPDGVVLTSPITSGNPNGRKAWVAQTVFDADLGAIRIPALVVAHAEDKCVRTPPDLSGDIAKKTDSVRRQAVMVTGGPGWPGDTGLKACRGKAPHGFFEQEAEVAAGIARFVTQGAY